MKNELFPRFFILGNLEEMYPKIMMVAIIPAISSKFLKLICIPIFE